MGPCEEIAQRFQAQKFLGALWVRSTEKSLERYRFQSIEHLIVSDYVPVLGYCSNQIDMTGSGGGSMLGASDL